jgi:hypothetical protein
MTPYLNGIFALIFAVAIVTGFVGALAGSSIIHVLAMLVAIVALFGLVSRWIDHPSERRIK